MLTRVLRRVGRVSRGLPNPTLGGPHRRLAEIASARGPSIAPGVDRDRLVARAAVTCARRRAGRDPTIAHCTRSRPLQVAPPSQDPETRRGPADEAPRRGVVASRSMLDGLTPIKGTEGQYGRPSHGKILCADLSGTARHAGARHVARSHGGCSLAGFALAATERD